MNPYEIISREDVPDQLKSESVLKRTEKEISKPVCLNVDSILYKYKCCFRKGYDVQQFLAAMKKKYNALLTKKGCLCFF